ncbi:MAG: hypothetical protein WBC70_10940 [Candidatus Aminicenantales bacterium]
MQRKAIVRLFALKSVMEFQRGFIIGAERAEEWDLIERPFLLSFEWILDGLDGQGSRLSLCFLDMPDFLDFDIPVVMVAGSAAKHLRLVISFGRKVPDAHGDDKVNAVCLKIWFQFDAVMRDAKIGIIFLFREYECRQKKKHHQHTEADMVFLHLQISFTQSIWQ